MHRRVLYLGLDVPDIEAEKITHYPVIKIKPRQMTDNDINQGFQNLQNYTHLLFTSKSAVRIFCELLTRYDQSPAQLNKIVIAIGQSTANLLSQLQLPVNFIAEEESSEGVVKLLSKIPMKNAHLFWPHSALSRPVLTNFFKQNNVKYTDCIVYDTINQAPGNPPDLSQIDEIIFSSPSTVDGFLKIYKTIPKGVMLTTIGEVTKNYLDYVRKEVT